jgi:predicted site-specific integrase-resolvase
MLLAPPGAWLQSVGMTTATRLTSQQTADALGVHRATVHRWVTQGKLQPAEIIQLGEVTVYQFDAAYVAELAARQRSA